MSLYTLCDALLGIPRTRQVSWEQAQRMRAQGYRLGALHRHSAYSYDCPKTEEMLPERLVEEAHRQGIDYVAITDHHLDAASYRGPLYNGWINGAELAITDKRIGRFLELNVLNIPSAQNRREIFYHAYERHDAYATTESALEAGCTVIANHCWFLPGSEPYNREQYWDLVRRYRLPVELNAARNGLENLATLYYALYYDLPLVAGSDDHSGAFPPVATVAQGDSKEEFLGNIREGNTYVVARSSGPFSHAAMFSDYMRSIVQGSGNTLDGIAQDTEKIHWAVHTAEKLATNGFLGSSPPIKHLKEQLVYKMAHATGACSYVGSLMRSGIKMGIKK